MNFRQFSTLLGRKPSSPAPETTAPKEEKGYDHLVFLVHGIGEHEEKWKVIVPKLERCHKKVENYMGVPARVKWIPIEWHSVLHTQTDEHVVKVTPKGATGPRSFINNTLIDLLFWASPYSQTIITEVGQQLNQSYWQFKKDYPDFDGNVSIYAHSLGSLICYDLLSNQQATTAGDCNRQAGTTANNTAATIPSDTAVPNNSSSAFSSPKSPRKAEGNVATWQRLSSKPTTLPSTEQLPGEPQVKYPQIEFEIENFFMVGSPTGVFLVARGADYPIRLPKCTNIYNIYNPNDPVSYLIEPLVHPGFVSLPPSVVPHIPDPTEAIKGAVARGSKSLFSYYKNTTTTTTTTTATGTSTTTTTTVTKEVLPASSAASPSSIASPSSPASAPASTVSSPTILTGTVYAPTGIQFMPVVVCNQTLRTTTCGHIQPSLSESTVNNRIYDSSPTSPRQEADVFPFDSTNENSTMSAMSAINALTMGVLGDADDEAFMDLTSPALSPRSDPTANPTLSPPSDATLSPPSDATLSPRPDLPANAASVLVAEEKAASTSSGSASSTPANANGSSDKPFFDGIRYDYKLQSSGIVENLSEYAALINAHRCYWYSKDVMLFVLKHLL